MTGCRRDGLTSGPKKEVGEEIPGENAGEVDWPLGLLEGGEELPGKDAGEVGWPLDQW